MFDPIWSVLLVEGDFKSVVVGRESGAIEKFRLSDIKGKPILSLKTAHKGTVTALVASPAGGDEIYSVSSDKSICQWNLTDDIEQLESEGGKRLIKATPTNTALRCAVVASEVICCGGADGAVHALREGALERWLGHSDAVSCVAQCQTEAGDGILASGSYDGKIRLWNVATGACIYLLAGHTTHLKGVQFINGHLGVMGLSRDDTMRLWLMPEELNVSGGADGVDDEEGAEQTHESPEDENEGEEDEEGTTTLSGPKGTVARRSLKAIDCSAIIALPAAPLCVAAQPESETPLFVIGLSGGGLVTVKANKFYTAVSTFIKINKSEVKKERKRLDVLLKGDEKKDAMGRKRALRKKKKELTDEQLKEESDKKQKEKSERHAARQAAREASHGDEDEEGEEQEEEPEVPEEDFDEEEEEEGEGVALTEERQEKLKQFKEEQKKEADEKMKSLRTSVGNRKKLLDPIDAKKFERDQKQFADVAFTRYHSKAASDSISAVALNGTKAIVASGNGLSIVDATPGVQNI